MFESRNQRNFSSAPQSVTALIATVLEPAITVLVYVAALYWHQEPVGRADLTLCFLVVALTWPGINRFRDHLRSAAVGILGSWLTLLAILAGFGYGTRSLDLFDREVLLFWMLVTPVLQLIAVRLGFVVLRRESANTRSRRSAVVIGAGSLGVKVARAIASRPAQGINFVGYFDDRADARVHADSAGHWLGSLRIKGDHDITGKISAAASVTYARRSLANTVTATLRGTSKRTEGCDISTTHRSSNARLSVPLHGNSLSCYGQLVLQ